MVDGARGQPLRVRPGLRRVVLWVGPVLLAIAAWQIWDAIEADRVERRIANAFPEGLVEPQDSSDGENAARYYVAASSAVLWPADSQVRFASVAWGLREALASGAARAITGRDEAFTLAERNQLSLNLIEQASSLPFGAFRPGTEFNFRFGGLVQVAHLSALKTLDALAKGDGAAAALSLRARLKLLRAFKAERRSYGAAAIATELQGIAIDVALVLARTPPPEAVLDELSTALSESAADDGDRFVRAESLSRYELLNTLVDGRRSTASVFLRPLLRHHLAGSLEVATDSRAAVRRPWPDRIAAMNAVPEHRSSLPEIVPFVSAWRLQALFRDLIPRMGAGVAAARCARLAIAVERHRRSHGAFPRQLSELEWSGPAETLLDPFTGRPLRYVTSPGGYALYGVGPDASDDGGKLFPQPMSGRPSGTGPTPDVGVVVNVSRSN